MSGKTAFLTPADTDSSPSSWRIWLAALGLAILWHALILWIHPNWSPPTLPPRVDVKQIDPKKLDAIREQWRKNEARERQKQLLLNKDKNLPSEKDAPENARYESDRNIRVEKEQRARQTNVIPKAGGPAVPAQPDQAMAPKSAHKSALGNLGVPLDLTPPQKALAEQRQAQPRQHPMEEGGDQALLDKNLPEGSENLLNAQESIYYSFYARLYEAIGPVWQSKIREIPRRRRVMPGEYSTVVDVVFDQQGNLLAIRPMRYSGIPEFDAAVESAWRRIGHFPNPPKGLLDSSGQVHTGWTFTVQVGAGSAFQYLPPEQNY